MSLEWTMAGFLAAALFAAAAGIWAAFRRLDRDYRERAARRVEAAFAFGRALRGSVERRPIWAAAAEAAKAVLDAPIVRVLVPETGGGRLIFAAGDVPSDPDPIPLESETGPAICFQTIETVVADDFDLSKSIDAADLGTGGARAALWVPIARDEECFGVIEVEERDRSFSAEETRGVERLARQTAEALLALRESEVRARAGQADRLAAVREFAERLTREIEEPLAAIRRESEEGAADVELSADELRGRLERVAATARRTLALLAELGRVSGPGGGQTTVDLGELVETVVREWNEGPARRSRIVWEATNRPSSLKIKADREQLAVILAEVARLAGEAARAAGGAAVRLRLEARAGRAWLVASGEGCLTSNAAAAAEADSTFDICRVALERRGGALRVDPGGPDPFRVEIEYPLCEDSSTFRRDAGEREPTASRSSETVLVVAVDPETRACLVEGLGLQGCRAVPVASAVEAWDLADRVAVDWVFCEWRTSPWSAAELRDRLRPKGARFVFVDEASETDSGEGRGGDFDLTTPLDADAVGAAVDRLRRLAAQAPDESAPPS